MVGRPSSVAGWSRLQGLELNVDNVLNVSRLHLTPGLLATEASTHVTSLVMKSFPDGAFVMGGIPGGSLHLVRCSPRRRLPRTAPQAAPEPSRGRSLPLIPPPDYCAAKCVWRSLSRI